MNKHFRSIVISPDQIEALKTGAPVLIIESQDQILLLKPESLTEKIVYEEQLLNFVQGLNQTEEKEDDFIDHSFNDSNPTGFGSSNY